MKAASEEARKAVAEHQQQIQRLHDELNNSVLRSKKEMDDPQAELDKLRRQGKSSFLVFLVRHSWGYKVSSILFLILFFLSFHFVLELRIMVNKVYFNQ
jgi:hypothetical protein